MILPFKLVRFRLKYFYQFNVGNLRLQFVVTCEIFRLFYSHIPIDYTDIYILLTDKNLTRNNSVIRRQNALAHI